MYLQKLDGRIQVGAQPALDDGCPGVLSDNSLLTLSRLSPPSKTAVGFRCSLYEKELGLREIL